MALHHDNHSPTEILSWSMEVVIRHASCSNEDSEAAHRGKNQGMKKTTRHPELGSVRAVQNRQTIIIRHGCRRSSLLSLDSWKACMREDGTCGKLPTARSTD